MKQLCLSLLLLGLWVSPIMAATATPSASPVATASGSVKGINDDPFASEYSDTATISALASPTPISRAVSYSTATTPVSGVVENTIALLLGGALFIVVGFRLSKP